MAKAILPNPMIILAAGAPGVGKTTVLKSILPKMENVSFLGKDDLAEDFLHSNPFQDPMAEDVRLSFHDPLYKSMIKNQVYASMFRIAMANAKLGKSTILDACWIGWLKDPTGPYSLARRLANFFDYSDLRNVRMPILYFYCDDHRIVKKRLQERAKNDKAAHDRDWPKIADNKSWQEQIEKEPTKKFGDLNLYRDILFVDRSKEWEGNEIKDTTEAIFSFLCHSGIKTLGNSGIFRDENLSDTVKRLKKP